MIKKNIFITGSGSGLGKAAVIALAKRGHRVFASVHYENQIQPLKEIATSKNLDIEVFKLDLLEKEDRNKINNYDIDVFICNAAIGDSGSVADIHVDRLRATFETNVFCNIEAIQLALKNMINIKKKGRIVILSSLVGRIPIPFLSPYCATKFALEAFGMSLRKELKYLEGCNIEVCLIEPGAYATGFNKENSSKKFSWINDNSYFKKYSNKIKEREILMWNLIEYKKYNSIIKRYIKSVECKKLKKRYSAPIFQTFFVQLGRIIGM